MAFNTGTIMINNSIKCEKCNKWVHKRCTGIKGSLARMNSRCLRVDNAEVCIEFRRNVATVTSRKQNGLRLDRSGNRSQTFRTDSDVFTNCANRPAKITMQISTNIQSQKTVIETKTIISFDCVKNKKILIIHSAHLHLPSSF